MADFTVTPWEVSGKVDYERLVKEFGTVKITEDLFKRLFKHKKPNAMLRRSFVFSHRDLDLALNDYDNKKGFFLYTGRGPTGHMHIGHLTPFLITKWFQEAFNVNRYISLSDDEKFLFKRGLEFQDTDHYAYNNILDIIALGFDPNRTFIFKDTEYMGNMYKLSCKIARKVTLSTAKAVFGFNDQSNLGLPFYTAVQTAPTFFENKRCLVPSAIDQDNYFRVQRDVAESLGGFKAAAIHNKLLPSLMGEAKMSTTQGENAVFLNDDEKNVKNKIMKYAFSGGRDTLEEHRKHGGNPDIDVSFQWLKILFEENDEKLMKIEEEYRSGKLLSGELKQILVDKINSFLKNHAKQRKLAEKKVKKFMHSGKLAKNMWDTKF